jgi:hypothetical protein
MRLGFLRQLQEVLRVAPSDLIGPARLLEPLAGVLADRLERRVALIRVSQKALVDERLEGVEISVRNAFGGLEGTPTAEHRESGEEPLFALAQEVVAPLDGTAERPLTLGQVAGTTGEQRQPLLQTREDLR